MKITGIIWLEEIIDKLFHKHSVERYEVKELLNNSPKFRFIEKGDRPDEDVYSAAGRTASGRYMIVFFVYKVDQRALILSARDMSSSERKRYGRK